MTTATKAQLNGLNLKQLYETLDAIRAKPELAKFKFRVSNRWINGGQNETRVTDFDGTCQLHEHRQAFVFRADEPPVLLGEDSSANPVEYLLTALAGCLMTSLVVHAAARGIKVEEVEARLEGDIDLQGFLGLADDVPKGFEAIRVAFKVKADVPDEKLEDILQLAPTFSPVYNTLTQSVPVTVTLAR
jgi:uncharacterized OsmC-like protein